VIRYFVRRHAVTGDVLELARIHKEEGRMWGEYWQDGAWHESARVATYTFDVDAADEIPEAEATRILGELTRKLSARGA
jgi:hypothetical protein